MSVPRKTWDIDETAHTMKEVEDKVTAIVLD